MDLCFLTSGLYSHIPVDLNPDTMLVGDIALRNADAMIEAMSYSVIFLPM